MSKNDFVMHKSENTVNTINELSELKEEDFDKINEVMLADVSTLDSIPEKIYLLKNLKKLEFVHSKIKNVSGAIGNLINLESINMFGNFELTDLPIEINKLEKLKYIGLPFSCINYNFGGLYNLQALQYDTWPNRTILPEIFQLYHIYDNKLFAFESNYENEIPDTITHINCHKSLYKQLNNMPHSVEFLRTTYMPANNNFPPSLKELNVVNSCYTTEEIKVPFGCKVYIKNLLCKKNVFL